MVPSCPYRVLGVAQDASHEEIKAAFRKLSKETHPDTAGSNADPERFKQISQAASVLSNPKKRLAHDQLVQSQPTPSFARRSNRGHHHHPPFFAMMMRPRNLLWVPVSMVVTVAALQYAVGEPSEPPPNLVQAWWNPRTRRYETPAPWDPLFQSTAVEQVPRNLVRHRSR